MRKYLTWTQSIQASMIAGMIAAGGLPLAITIVAGIIELLR